MSEGMPIPWVETRTKLMQSEPAFYELEPGGSLAVSLDDEAWMLEVTPDGRLICQTGMDMDDIQSLLSTGTPEDLGTDELAKQAKYYLQPAVTKYRKTLVGAGFEENMEMNDQYVAATFQRALDFANLEAVKQAVKWCRERIK